jgi:hypothetical protein
MALTKVPFAMIQGMIVNALDRGISPSASAATNDAAIAAAIAALSEGDVLYFPKGTYNISQTITINKRINLLGDGPRATYIQNQNTSFADAIAFTTTWYQAMEGIQVIGNPQSGNGLNINSSHFDVTNCWFSQNGLHGIFITPQNWTIEITNCTCFENTLDGLNMVATGPNGQINAVNTLGSVYWRNLRNGITVCGTAINILACDIEANESIGVRVDTSDYSTYSLNIKDNYFEINKDGHIFFDLTPSLGHSVFFVNIEGNYMYMYAADANPGAVFISAVTDTYLQGITSINIDKTNFILTDSLKHISLNDAITKEGQSRIETVMCGDTADFSLFYENIGAASLNTYQQRRVVSGYFLGKGGFSFASLERSANSIAGVTAAPVSALYPLQVKTGDTLKKTGVYIATDSTNYSVTFTLYKRVSTGAAAYSAVTLQALTTLNGSAFRQTSDFSSLTNVNNFRVADNEEWYLEITCENTGGGGTFFYLYNPIVTSYAN